MSELRALWSELRVMFTLVPWRMRPKMIAILVGSAAVALLDMAAVVLMVPVMQLVSGVPIEDSEVLSVMVRYSGVDGARGLLIVTLLTVVGLMVAKNLFTIAFRWWSLGIMADAQTAAAHSMMSRYMGSPYLSHRRRSSDIILQTLTNLLPTSFGSVTAQIVQLVVDGFSSLVLLVALVAISPIATIVALVFFGGAAFLMQWALKGRTVGVGVRMNEANLASWGYLSPAVDGFKEVRLTDSSGLFAKGFERTRHQANRLMRTASLLSELPKYLLEIVMIVGIMVIAMALFATSTEREALTFLGVFAVASVRIIPTLNRMLASVAVIRAGRAGLTGLVDQIRELRGEVGAEDPAEPEYCFPRGDIEFRNVTFQFPDAERPVLASISGVIPQGRTVALVGASGAGKTTFVEMLLALFPPSAGVVTVGNQSIHTYPRAWRRQLGVVVQDVYLADRTVRENIAFGVAPEEIDEGRLHRAVELAQLKDVISAMPEGLDTKVGYRGTRVSGGQKQRIGIARALYRDPQVLILDEATSALDNETERRITQTIEDLHGSMTIIVVAHRLSTVKNADIIFFFSGGEIVARGTMAELVASNAEFAELVRLGNLQ